MCVPIHFIYEHLQNVHRQLNFCTVTPPTIGPRAGPRSGRKPRIAKDLPRSSALQQSATIAPETANSALAPNPAISLPIIIKALFRENPQTVFHRQYHADPNIQIGRRPQISEQGASSIGPKAKASRYIDKTNDASFSEMLRSFPMSCNPGASIAPDIKVTRPPKLTRIVVNHLRFRLQFRGFKGSEELSQDTFS